MAGRPKKTDAFLDVEAIVAGAWRIVDREGVDALSTRSLAAELGVKGPALYWHVRNKQSLFSLMTERLLLDSFAAADGTGGWDDWMLAAGRSLRASFLSRRDSGRIAASAPPTERMGGAIMPRLVGPLTDAGFAARDATAAGGTLASLVLGWVIYEQSEEAARLIHSMVDPDEAFEFGLSSLVAGLRITLPAGRRAMDRGEAAKA